jgi:hypothetical protein
MQIQVLLLTLMWIRIRLFVLMGILLRIRLQYGSGSRSATLNTTDFTRRVPVPAERQKDKIVNEKRNLVVAAAINKSRRQK